MLATHPFVIDVTTADFATTVIERSRTVPVVVDFWAAWCGPCRMLGPVLERLANEANGAWILAKLDTDANQPLARQFGIQSIPAVKAFRDGKVVSEFIGAQPEGQIRRWLAALAPSEVDTLAREAASAAVRGDAAARERALQALEEADPRHADVLIARAERAVARGDRAEAAAALGQVREEDRAARASQLGALSFALEAPPIAEAEATRAAAPDDPAAIYALGAAYAAAARWEDALELFLHLVARHRPWGDDAGRKAMLRVFDVVGIRSPIAESWRRRLSMELYK